MTELRKASYRVDGSSPTANSGDHWRCWLGRRHRKTVRVAAGTQLARLVDDCETDLGGRELNPKHVHNTKAKLLRWPTYDLLRGDLKRAGIQRDRGAVVGHPRRSVGRETT